MVVWGAAPIVLRASMSMSTCSAVLSIRARCDRPPLFTSTSTRPTLATTWQSLRCMLIVFDCTTCLGHHACVRIVCQQIQRCNHNAVCVRSCTHAMTCNSDVLSSVPWQAALTRVSSSTRRDDSTRMAPRRHRSYATCSPMPEDAPVIHTTCGRMRFLDDKLNINQYLME